MLDVMSDYADTDQFYDPKTDSWHTPLASITIEEPSQDTPEPLSDEDELAEVMDAEADSNPDGIDPNSLNFIEVMESVGLNVAVIDENTDFSKLKLPEESNPNRPHPALGTIKRRI
jgi:hypothetical protein